MLRVWTLNNSEMIIIGVIVKLGVPYKRSTYSDLDVLQFRVSSQPFEYWWSKYKSLSVVYTAQFALSARTVHLI
ncbi:unnamed protein product [Leptosia nina]|uniref:Uncharacterized protein n=1 Tax=Leptosia nina TaxID=320188 RepID=A0AAV1J907_9NEOP